MLFYQLLYTQYFLWDPQIHRIIHLGFALTIVLLAITTRRNRFLMFLLLVAAVGVTVELVIIYPDVVGALVLPPASAIIGGIIALILCLLLTWRRFGLIFPIVTLVAFAYAIFGPYVLPEAIQPPQISILRLISWTSADLLSESGLYGEILSLIANYIWLFMVYGAFLRASGGLRFIQQLGTFISSKVASGAGMLSVVTSALIGSVTGSTAANITITGTFTIPMMKERGYTAEQAGAIELAASNGGQILPPIMGAAAFILASYIGMPYVKVMLFATIPALLYFFTLAIYVQIQAKKRHFARLESKVSGRELLLDSPLFLIPFIVLVLLLVQGYSLMFVGFWSIVSIAATGITSHLLRKEAKINWRTAKDSIVEGVVSASDISILAGVLGAIIGIVEFSGLGISLGSYLVALSGGNLFMLLVFAAIVCLILGTGIPSLGAYIITAVILAPPIVSLGVPLIAAHLFILVFAVFSHLTPPIGIGLVIASRMAGGSYWGTAREALKAAFIIFFLPFFFVYAPAIILQFEGLSLADIVMQFAVVIVLILSGSFLFNNYGLARLGFPEKGLFVIAGLSSLLFIIFPAQVWLFSLIAVISCIGGFGLNLRRSQT